LAKQQGVEALASFNKELHNQILEKDVEIDNYIKD